MNLYTDGGVIEKNPSPIGGTWAWVLVDDEEMFVGDSGVVSVKRIGSPVTNNQMEFYALIRGLYNLRFHTITHVYSDSNVSLGRLFKGWSMTNIPEFMLVMFRGLLEFAPHKSWTNIIELPYTLLDGHPTKAQLEAGIGKRGHPVSKWNVWCDKMCNQAGDEYVQRLRNNSSS